jgi:hypothetical protein
MNFRDYAHIVLKSVEIHKVELGQCLNLLTPHRWDAVRRTVHIPNLHGMPSSRSSPIQKRISDDLAKENDFLRQENKILHGELGKQVPLRGGPMNPSGGSQISRLRAHVSQGSFPAKVLGESSGKAHALTLTG